MQNPVSVIVPARNEAQTIGRVVGQLRDMVGIAEVVVIDNGSTDATAAQAEAAGARVVTEARPGMGHAVRVGVAAARHDWVMKVDADLDKFDLPLFANMQSARGPGVGLVKGAWNDPDDDMPMTRLLVRPALARMFPGLAHLTAPNSGIYLFDKSRIAHAELVGDYAVDIDVMLRVHAAGAAVTEVDIGRIVHDARDPQHYAGMAEQIFGFFLGRQPLDPLGEVVVIARSGAQVIGEALGHAGAKLRAGARVTVALPDGQATDAQAILAAMAAYPTARMVGLADLAGFQPGPHAGRVTVIAATGDMIHAAEALHTRLSGSLPVEVWQMPGAMQTRADVSVDVTGGCAIKRAALSRIGAATHCDRRELFIDATPDRPPGTAQNPL
ncbi:glycosyltransferase [Roseovarius tibetensis]|uniref:glycosyltransferase n=1 Tax=Roseovarius tibetensis TaxID=2685897 RepID=UPI003D7F5A0E